MKKVVSVVSLRQKRASASVVGYSKSDRGTKFVNGVVEIVTVGKDQAEVNAEITAAIVELLKAQSDPV